MFHLLTGFAAGAIQLTSTGIVSKYFDKHKDKVYAGTVAAFFAGVLIAPTLTKFLMKSTSYKYAMIIEASEYILIFPAALVYRHYESFAWKNF